MTDTNNLKLTLLEQSQAQKEITVNEALARIDAILNKGVIDKDLATPPGSPASGDLYIVAGSATGAWSGQSGKIAWFNQIWQFITPNEGISLWVNDEDKIYTYTGSAWTALATGGGGGGATSLSGLTSENISASPADASFVVYDSASSKWLNKTPANSRTALGLGTMATQSASSVALTGGTINGTSVGATTAAAGSFTTLAISSTVTGGALSVNAQTGTSYTITGTDNGKIITLNNSSTTTVTLPQNSTEALPAGFNVALIRLGAGDVVIAGQGSDTILSEGNKLKLNAQYAQGSIVKIVSGAPNTWTLAGSLKA